MRIAITFVLFLLAGQYQTIQEPLLDCERKLAPFLGGATCPNDDDYEDPEPPMTDIWPSLRILPARPIKESEYADTRYFKDGMDAPFLLRASPSIPPKWQSWNKPMGLEEVHQPIPRDTRSQQGKGNKSIKGNKIPPPPPRPPATLQKQHQPLPATPEGGSPAPQRRAFPEAQGGPRQISLKDLHEVLGAEKVSPHQIKPQSSHPSQRQNTQIPPAIPSSSFTTSDHSIQERDPKRSMKSWSPQRCQSPARCGPAENMQSCKTMSRRQAFPGSPDDQVIQHNEWYIGEYSRQAVEEALMRENKDGTFLVRDCSTKSKAEPYVLAVFYGNKVYNVKIRFLESCGQFALGTGLRGDQKFDSVEEIIEHYKHFPIVLIDGKDKSGGHKEQCYLTQPLPLARHRTVW